MPVLVGFSGTKTRLPCSGLGLVMKMTSVFFTVRTEPLAYSTLVRPLSFPPSTGRKSLLCFRLKGLADVGDEVTCASLMDDQRYLDSTPGFIHLLTLFPNTPLSSIPQAGLNSIVLRRWSLPRPVPKSWTWTTCCPCATPNFSTAGKQAQPSDSTARRRPDRCAPRRTNSCRQHPCRADGSPDTGRSAAPNGCAAITARFRQILLGPCEKRRASSSSPHS